MNHKSETEQLKDALASFQNKLETRVEPEQIDAWNDDVNASFDTLRGQLQQHRDRLHSKLLEKIASIDDGSEQRRIQSFEESDQRIAEFCDVVKTHIAAFGIDQLEPPSDDPNIAAKQQAVLENHRLELVDRAKELIELIKDQETSITTWFAEAFAEQVDDRNSF